MAFNFIIKFGGKGVEFNFLLAELRGWVKVKRSGRTEADLQQKGPGKSGLRRGRAEIAK